MAKLFVSLLKGSGLICQSGPNISIKEINEKRKLIWKVLDEKNGANQKTLFKLLNKQIVGEIGHAITLASKPLVDIGEPSGYLCWLLNNYRVETRTGFKLYGK